MKTIKELSGNAFKLFADGMVWEIIETDPKIYPNCVRARAGAITSPFNKDLLVFEVI